ncbi:MarR family winged helix-turn-helix transcriptional regulator [Martelella alba]|uniref:Winged helix-turn-helix transcriptional regulator n=1 Tax=Martelella alba TaxID=2590451 RepID=A0ABY2SK46_9HYPH|nr:MarR family winged helix-turn-helix transcriptional regulator [Martelella alba]TKI05119.1 winged helix-turn-helix transcriptional regulator [Martelella alba]
MAITVTLGLLHRAYRARADKVVAPMGLSTAMAWPLVLIGRHPEGIRPGNLSGKLGIEGPSLVRSLNQLVDADLVLRREDLADKRAKVLYLTPTGAAISSQIESLLNALRAELFEGLSDRDIRTCLRTFSLLAKRLDLGGTSLSETDQSYDRPAS